MKNINYKTGDLILFSGKSLFSKIIKAQTMSDISHVGIVIVENGIPLICESTTLTDLIDHKNGKVIKGVQKHILKDRVSNYDGKVYYSKLLVDIPKVENMLDWLSVVHSKETKYDTKQAIFSGLFIKDFINSKPNFNKLFCSELVFKALQEGGVIAKRFNASKQNPKNIYDLPFFESKIKI